MCGSLLLCFLSFFLHANVRAEAPAPFAAVPLRVMSWNTQFGEGTDAVTNYDRTASWIASVNPDLVGLCEVPSGSIPGLVSSLINRTGRTWFYHFVPKYNGTDEGNLILTWHPIVSTNARFLSAQRSVAQATVNIGGRNVSFFATHFDDAASSNRVVEAGELKSWATNFAEPRIMTGDFNGSPDTAEASSMSESYYDSWNEAMNRGTASSYPDNPQYNPVVDTAFGRRTDFFPSETHLSPRIGFTYNYGGKSERQTLGSIRGGIGEFRGRAPSQLFASAVDANGLPNGQAQLVCVGSSVPLPDWPAFIDDPSLVPSTCNGPSQTFGNQRRNVTVFSPDFAAPRAWRSSLGFSRRFLERYNLSLDASYSRGVAQTSATDLNLNTTPKFALATEQGRYVYTPVATIVPTTGVAALSGSRIDPRFGVVTEMNSNLQSDTKQLTASLGGITTKAIVFNTSYTFMRSRDQQRGLASFGGGGFGGGGFGSGGGATTAGNPNIAEWATSDLERRHSFLATVTWPIKPSFELTAIGRLSSGGFYTPGVSGDVNGDGLRNDRAFIFNPLSAPDTAIANGMSRLLASAPDRARQCIESQIGNIANRNSCSLPWSTSFDLQANIKPSAFGLNHKLTISLVGLNTLSGIDQLLHGKNLHGWGQPAFADRTLLYVRGFDPAAQRYLYQVNEHFGAASGSRNAFRVPFQLSLQARLAIGVDPAQQQMRNVFGGGRGGRPSVQDFRQRLSRAVPNTFRQILDLNDSLKLELTDDQKAKLTTAGDSLQAKADTLIGALAQQLGTADKNADPMQLGMKMRGKIQEGRKLAETAIADAEKILTPDQWAKVPKNVKEPLQGRGQGGEGGFRGPPDR